MSVSSNFPECVMALTHLECFHFHGYILSSLSRIKENSQQLEKPVNLSYLIDIYCVSCINTKED